MRFYFEDIEFIDYTLKVCYLDFGDSFEIFDEQLLIRKLAENIYNIFTNINAKWTDTRMFIFCDNQKEYDQLNSEYTLFLLQKN
jgi:hypothetical protein